MSIRHWKTAGLLTLAAALLAADGMGAQERPAGQGFSFRTGVELVSVTVTVTDDRGRFVRDLKQDDFLVYEDGELQTVSQFDSERVPVSLGVALDTSGSMIGEKIAAAQAALNRFLFDLLGPQDEVFLYRFDSRPLLVQGWTENRAAVAQALGTVKPSGGTAIYDAVGEAVPLAQSGSRRKKALVLISDGNDTSSRTTLGDIQQRIRQSEVLVYAIGIDASNGIGSSSSNSGGSRTGNSAPASNQPQTIPVPSPFPGKGPTTRTVTPPPPPPPPPPPQPSSSRSSGSATDRINADTLRALSDDSGGRTEIIVSARDLDPATAGIADELSRQYFLGYTSTRPKDGKWHAIEVKLRRGNHTIRARKGFIAG